MVERFVPIFSLILLFLLITTKANSQKLEYRLGEVLFSITEREEMDRLTSDIRTKLLHERSVIEIREVSKTFGIWSVRFDHSQVHQIDFLQTLRRHPLISAAQFNHLLEKRTIPDDPYFSDQWHLYNTGQNGGTFGVDLDMPYAWQNTTGGLSHTGDTIVLCIIDEYFNYEHNDLAANVWINYHEIPDNEIDDDNNGYVDDFYGWNVANNSDNISNAGSDDHHGTGVSGIAGAVGNNGKGISGICWNIKMMLVSRGSTTADAIEAYTYPFTQRRIYNESLGQAGAFVVATNTSWGLDFAFPGDAPLWCAMYDSLGSVGILNAAATSNSNINVEEVGDLPTTCTSPFLITTTSVDHNDQKVADAGYGATSIDLASFGTEVLSTSEVNSYDYFSGTSVAAPQLTGAIGLLHAAPCPSFATFVKSNPSTAALTLKSYLLEGVEANASLANITSTGGRLNVNNSLSLLMDDCDYSGCFTPFEVEIVSIDTNAVNISWSVEIATMAVNARFRVNGNDEWTVVNDVNSTFHLNDLLPCTAYELQLQSICVNAESAFTASFNFTTDGCCTAPSDIIVAEGNTLIILDWAPVSSAVAYDLRYRPQGISEWEIVTLQQSFYQIDNLEPCQLYEVQLATICADGQNKNTEIFAITTKGCGPCIDLPYCNASGASNSQRWISRLKIMDWEHYSTLNINTGYQDFTDQGTTLTLGGVHALEIETDYNFFASAGFFHVWLDLNQDGQFSAEELLYQSSAPEYEVDDILAIPTNALHGATRMRLAFVDQPIEPCTNFTLLGEVEDYCMSIIEATECLPPINFTVHTTNNTADINWSGGLTINEYAFHYRPLGLNNDWEAAYISSNNLQLSDLDNCTDYVYYISAVCDGEESPPSAIQSFRTKGCGRCLDATYCSEYQSNSTQFEWIEQVNIAGYEYTSGNNEGYAQIPDLPINLEKGQSYEIIITPGFPTDSYEEHLAIWFDANGDGIFQNPGELIAQGISTIDSSFSATLYIPEMAYTGSSRLRISMKYGTALADPCESGFEGEIEDYCVNILPPGSQPCMDTYISAVNGLDSSIMEVQWASVEGANAYRLRYRPKYANEPDWSVINTELTEAVFATELCALQEFQVQVHCPLGWSAYSELVEASTCDHLVVPVSEVGRTGESKFQFYPNPFENTAFLQMELADPKPLRVQIFSAVGSLVQEYLLADPDVADQLCIGPLPAGIYFLQVWENERPIYTTRILAQAP